MAKLTILPLALILWFLLSQTLFLSKPLEGCIAKERAALLSFKEGLDDPNNRLSTWRGEDCCAWRGVACSNKTGHVVRLDLPNTNLGEFGMPDPDYGLSGKLSSSLVALRHINYLDLSMNFFNGSPIPEFIGSMSSLRYLNLSGTSFSGGSIPPQLGNLSNLIYLDLNNELSLHFVQSNDLAWLCHLLLLEHLDMTNVKISTVANWAQIMTMLPSLKHLYLDDCGLQKTTFSPLFSNFSNLVTLDIGSNFFGDTTYLNCLRNLTSLKYLDISENSLNGIVPGMFNNLCNIKELDLSGNSINIDIAELVHGLPECLWSKMQSLKLGYTNLVGNLSSILEQMSGLTTLDLFTNNLTGPIPYSIRATRLRYLDLSGNRFDGMVSKDHFVNLSSLQSLYLYGNSLIIEQNWIPPTKLRWVKLNSCKLGPKFPQWINRLTNIIYLDISNTGIVDKLPDWFRNISSHLLHLDMSYNQISGNIHKALEFSSFIKLYLHNNLFEGRIPPLPESLISLDLSSNSLSGPLPSMLRAHNLVSLFLHNNMLSGTIPASICQLKHLQQLDLSSNLLKGPIPMCWTDSNFNTSKGFDLIALVLRNNSLSDTFPSFLKYCQQLLILDLSYNEFSGNLPSWIGEKLSSLAFLLLRSNMFSGNIPTQITMLYGLGVLDLAQNNFVGTLPSSMNAFSEMTQIGPSFDNPFLVFGSSHDSNRAIYANVLDVVFKGLTLEFGGRHSILITSIDLSFNRLTGEIPEEISSLIGLRGLNLSGNRLSGNIPWNIDTMQTLESLDLSNNYLSGEIPSGISNLFFLDILNLSYNNLSGKIPSGGQLQTLEDPYIYIGNSGLCGPPLSKNCSGNGSNVEDESDVISLYLGICIGFIFGLWLVFCVCLFKRRYRIAYFRAMDDLYDRIYVFVVLSWKSAFGKYIHNV